MEFDNPMEIDNPMDFDNLKHNDLMTGLYRFIPFPLILLFWQ